MLAERWHIMPWQMRRVTPKDLGKINELVELEVAEHEKAERKAKRETKRGRARR